MLKRSWIDKIRNTEVMKSFTRIQRSNICKNKQGEVLWTPNEGPVCF